MLIEYSRIINAQCMQGTQLRWGILLIVLVLNLQEGEPSFTRLITNTSAMEIRTIPFLIPLGPRPLQEATLIPCQLGLRFSAQRCLFTMPYMVASIPARRRGKQMVKNPVFQAIVLPCETSCPQ